MIEITRSHRWTRQREYSCGGEGWVEVPCFCMTGADGNRTYCDELSPEDRAEFDRQEAARVVKAEAA